MPFVQLEQGSSKWLSYRQSKVMATDTPVILGSNPWVTKLQKWEEKQPGYILPEMNEAMKQGQLREPIARDLIIEMLGINFIPIVYESDTYPWMASSLDGISDCGEYILEIKCPSKEKLHVQAINGDIPEYYSDQMQHQLKSKPNVKINFYCTYYPNNKKSPITLMEIKHDHEKQKQIIDKGYEFYTQLCTMQPPVDWKLKEIK